jgi:nucleoside-diphosphate-sugar epimerase
VKEIVAALGPTAGAPQLGAVPVRPLEQDVSPDIEGTAAVLGWRAGIALDEGIRRTVAWHRAS